MWRRILELTGGTAQLAAGAGLDLLLGDPRWLPHPVQGIGFLVRRLEQLLRRSRFERSGGAILVVIVIGITAGFVAATLRWFGPSAAVYWIFSCLAVRSLDQHAIDVIGALKAGDVDNARNLVGKIVGRDINGMPESEIVRAVFETVAENLSDGVVAPLCFLAVFGVPGMVAYKAINTMDSMIGYKNDRYIRFGWAAARLDDVANYIPARVTAGLTIVAAALWGLRWQSAVTVVLRDARLQPSPNSGYPEAAFAGALGVQLGGLNYYFGHASPKPFIGDPVNCLERHRFRDVRRLMYTVAVICYLGVGIWFQLR